MTIKTPAGMCWNRFGDLHSCTGSKYEYDTRPSQESINYWNNWEARQHAIAVKQMQKTMLEEGVGYK